jgi:hypothetical protein
MMFGVVSLLIVLAIVASLVRGRVEAATASAAPPGDATAPASVPDGARRLQQQVEGDVRRALEQGARRANDDAR